METRSQSKSKRKRHGENAEFKQRKSQRLALRAESVSTTRKIIDLNDDCLMSIFGRLDLRSLFNVAIANKWLQPAARDVYKRKFGQRMLCIRQCEIVRPLTMLNVNECSVVVFGLKMSLQFLRCFGPSISELCLHYGPSSSKRFDHVLQYINDYCAGTLTRINFRSMPNIEIKQFKKVFTNVQHLGVGGVLGRQWPTFVKSFPNVRELCFDRVHMVHRCPEQPFEHLVGLFLLDSQCFGFTMDRFVADVLRGIHQLKKFMNFVAIVDGEPTILLDTLLDVIGLNPSLEELDYDLRKRKLITASAAVSHRIITDYPALTRLELPNYRFTANDAMLVAMLHGSLKKFLFQMHKSQFELMKTQLNGKWTAVDEEDEYDAFNDDHVCVSINRV